MKTSRFTIGSKQVDRSTVRNVLIGIYVLLVLGLSATARAEQQFMPVKPSEKFAVATLRGVVVHTMGGEYLLVVNKNEQYVLDTNIDLSHLDRVPVKVIGIGANVSTGTQQEESLVPLTEDVEQREMPVLSVLEISEELY